MAQQRSGAPAAEFPASPAGLRGAERRRGSGPDGEERRRSRPQPQRRVGGFGGVQGGHSGTSAVRPAAVGACFVFEDRDAGGPASSDRRAAAAGAARGGQVLSSWEWCGG